MQNAWNDMHLACDMPSTFSTSSTPRLLAASIFGKAAQDSSTGSFHFPEI
jgi:hypothetical protein